MVTTTAMQGGSIGQNIIDRIQNKNGSFIGKSFPFPVVIYSLFFTVGNYQQETIICREMKVNEKKMQKTTGQRVKALKMENE